MIFFQNFKDQRWKNQSTATSEHCRIQNIVCWKQLLLYRHWVGQGWNSVWFDLSTHERSSSGTNYSDSQPKLNAAVEYLHTNWIIHRDIKHANILLQSNGTIKIYDFGVSKTTKAIRTKPTTRKGTIHYCPPEFFDDDLPLTDKSDVWSIGVTLYEMSTGHLPFADSNLLQQLSKVYKSEPTFPNNLFSSNPLQINEICVLFIIILNSTIRRIQPSKIHNSCHCCNFCPIVQIWKV
jgi:serine/threonine protein kinase